MTKKSTNVLNYKSYQLTYRSPYDPFFKKWIIGTVEKLTGISFFQKIYKELRRENSNAFNAAGRVLNKLNVRIDFNEEQLSKIPTKGPVIFIANHPFGVVDGVSLCHLVSRKRKDFVILVDQVLSKEPIMKDHLLPVDFRGNDEAIQVNQRTKERAIQNLKNGGSLAIFPAGVVSTCKYGFGKVEDMEWRKFICQPIHEIGCTVVPIYFHGRNSRLFQVVSQITMKLRRALLIFEVMNKRGKTIKVEIGNPISYAEMEQYKDRQELINFLRARTMGLAKKEY